MAKFIVESGRYQKAKKIESVLLDYLQIEKLNNKNILDIGCGNGEIITFFCKSNNTFAVDAMDQRSVNSNIDVFKLVDTAVLPFEENIFDIIISNHVVEHIADQKKHMEEIYRCLKPGGICYYATPNWNFFIEPHHKIPLIHYLGNRFFHGFLKLFNQYEEDILLLSHSEMIRSFKDNRFYFEEYTAKVIKNQKKFHLESNIFQSLPMKILINLQKIIPTNIFVLKKPNKELQ